MFDTGVHIDIFFVQQISYVENKSLCVHCRLPGAPQTPVSPTSPMPSGGMHPYATLLRQTEAARTMPKAPMFQPMSPPRVTPQPLPTTPIKEYCYSPLPTTPLPNATPFGGFFTPTPKTLADSELIEYHQEKAKEKEAIVHQVRCSFVEITRYDSIYFRSTR